MPCAAKYGSRSAVSAALCHGGDGGGGGQRILPHSGHALHSPNLHLRSQVAGCILHHQVLHSGGAAAFGEAVAVVAWQLVQPSHAT